MSRLNNAFFENKTNLTVTNETSNMVTQFVSDEYYN
jgi:hypothetical protein